MALPWGGILARSGAISQGISFVNSALTIPRRLRYLKDFGKSRGCPPDGLASSPGNQRAVFFVIFNRVSQLFSFWESSDVNLFPVTGGNCAQVVRRGCGWTDARASGFAGGTHFNGQGKSAVHAFSGYWRSRNCGECREDSNHRHEVGAEAVSPLHGLPGRAAHGRLPQAFGAQAGKDY